MNTLNAMLTIVILVAQQLKTKIIFKKTNLYLKI